MNFSEILECLLARQNLSAEHTSEIMSAILRGELSDAQLAAFLTAMRAKGEDVEELLSAVNTVRQFCTIPELHGLDKYYLVDTCGTGGDGASTFNISTLAAIVAASAGAKIAKHGNRSVSSSCGSADFLEKAGVHLQLDAQQVMHCIETVGIGFLFAPQFHQAMRFAAPVRKELGVKTLFNLLGPLCNPLPVRAQLVGVYAQHWLEPMAQLVGKLNIDRAMVVHSEDGLDEISLFAPTQVFEWHTGACRSYTIQPQDFFEVKDRRDSILVASTEESHQRGQAVLSGEEGAAQDIVALNAAAILYLSGVAEDISAGVRLACEVIQSGQSKRTLQALVKTSQQLKTAEP